MGVHAQEAAVVVADSHDAPLALATDLFRRTTALHTLVDAALFLGRATPGALTDANETLELVELHLQVAVKDLVFGLA